MRFRAILKRAGPYLTAAYVVLAALLSTWIASFAPLEGPALDAYIPSNAGLVFQIHSGTGLARTALDHKAFKELLKDPDFNDEFASILHLHDEAMNRWKDLPGIVQWLVPPDWNGLYPFVGRECTVVLCSSNGNKQPSVLILTKVSGLQGHLVRLASEFVRTKNGEITPLSGDTVAICLNGAKPGIHSSSEKTTSSILPEESKSDRPPLARLIVYPHNLPQPAKHTIAIPATQKDEKSPILTGSSGQKDELTDEHIDLDKIVTVGDQFGLKEPPKSITIDFTQTADGGLSASGRLIGTVPAVPLNKNSVAALSDPNAFAEALIPFDAKACFLSFLQGEMRNVRHRRDWLACFDGLFQHGVDLDRDLWCCFGPVVHVAFQEAPENFGSAEYGLVNAQLDFAGKDERTRDAIGALISGKWEIVNGKGDSSINGQYVVRMAGKKWDRYILMTRQIMAPSWTVGPDRLNIVSDAGPFALLDKSLDNPTLSASSQGPDAASKTPSFFIKLDGARMAPKMETWATKWFNDSEDEAKSTKEFLAKFPDAPRQIKLARKFTAILGKFSLELVPEKDGASIKMSWTPGTLEGQKEDKSNDSAPPPPPPN